MTYCDTQRIEEPGAKTPIGCGLAMDFCLNTSTVVEYSCTNNKSIGTFIKCQYGCISGACKSCPDSDNDTVCDANDQCAGQTKTNIPANTTCTDYSFNQTNGCHITINRPNGYFINSTNCDYLDTVCIDYSTVQNTCDGAGNYVLGTCGTNLTYRPNGFVINQTSCDYLDTQCRDYTNATNTCNGAGAINLGTCGTNYVNQPTATQCATDYTNYSCYWGNTLGSDIARQLQDYHCNGLGNCELYPGNWTIQQDCTNTQYCNGSGTSNIPTDYNCVACQDNDHDSVCDTVDSCVGQNQTNTPLNTTCTDYSFNQTNGCHITQHKTNGYIINYTDCDYLDTACADYSDTANTCDGAGAIKIATCNIINYRSSGFVVNIKNCDSLDTECKDYTSVNDICDGAGNIINATCGTNYINQPTATQCATDYTNYSCYWGNTLGSDIARQLQDYHCNGLGNCELYPGNWTIQQDCTNTQYCQGTGVTQTLSDFSCSNCADTDNDNVCDAVDNCIGQNQINIPLNTSCTTYSFNTTTGCHITNHKIDGFVINNKNCDHMDTACTDYGNVQDVCNGFGIQINQTCGTNLTHRPNGFVINQTSCDHLDTQCRDHANATNTCDGAGTINLGTCGSDYVNQPTTAQCGNDTTYYSCHNGTYFGSDIWSLLYDQHCDGLGSCITTIIDWGVSTDCTETQSCSGPVTNTTNNSDYSCLNCQIDCFEDADCNDNNASTIDTCNFKATCNSFCSYKEGNLTEDDGLNLIRSLLPPGNVYENDQNMYFGGKVSNIKKDMLAYWAFDEAAGNVAEMNGLYSLTQNGQVNSSSGIIGNSRGKYGNDTYFSHPTFLDNGIAGNGSVSLWFNTPAGSGDDVMMLFHKDALSTMGHFRCYLLFSGTDMSGNLYKLYCWMKTDDTITYLASPGYVPRNSWNHLVFNFGSSGQKMYLNNQLVAQNTVTDSFLGTAERDFTIGGIQGTNGNSFNGLIDEFGIWNRNLNEEEINHLYNNGNGTRNMQKIMINDTGVGQMNGLDIKAKWQDNGKTKVAYFEYESETNALNPADSAKINAYPNQFMPFIYKISKGNSTEITAQVNSIIAEINQRD